jgi:hypothetical protein
VPGSISAREARVRRWRLEPLVRLREAETGAAARALADALSALDASARHEAALAAESRRAREAAGRPGPCPAGGVPGAAGALAAEARHRTRLLVEAARLEARAARAGASLAAAQVAADGARGRLEAARAARGALERRRRDWRRRRLAAREVSEESEAEEARAGTGEVPRP